MRRVYERDYIVIPDGEPGLQINFVLCDISSYPQDRNVNKRVSQWIIHLAIRGDTILRAVFLRAGQDRPPQSPEPAGGS